MSKELFCSRLRTKQYILFLWMSSSVTLRIAVNRHDNFVLYGIFFTCEVREIFQIEVIAYKFRFHRSVNKEATLTCMNMNVWSRECFIVSQLTDERNFFFVFVRDCDRQPRPLYSSNSLRKCWNFVCSTGNQVI